MSAVQYAWKLKEPAVHLHQPKNQDRKRIGELIYCDIGGPITPITKDDERYYLTIIDDYSHFTEVYLLKTKDEAKDYIMKYINRMRNEGMNVQKIRTDRGGEFVKEILNKFYEKNGIKQETTCSIRDK